MNMKITNKQEFIKAVLDNFVGKAEFSQGGLVPKFPVGPTITKTPGGYKYPIATCPITGATLSCYDYDPPQRWNQWPDNSTDSFAC